LWGTEITVQILPEVPEGFAQGAAGSFWDEQVNGPSLSREFLTGALRSVANFVFGRSRIRVQGGVTFRGTIVQAKWEEENSMNPSVYIISIWIVASCQRVLLPTWNGMEREAS
jgi:hypothetical protein